MLTLISAMSSFFFDCLRFRFSCLPPCAIYADTLMPYAAFFFIHAAISPLLRCCRHDVSLRLRHAAAAIDFFIRHVFFAL